MFKNFIFEHLFNQNLVMKKIIYNAILLAALGLSVPATHAQTEDMSEFLKTGLGDGSKLLNAYASPLLKSFGAGLNAGWFNTAKVHGAGGFDITICPTNLTFAPSGDKTFDFNSLGLSSQLRTAQGQSSTMQTVFGSNTKSRIEMVTRYPGATQDSVRGMELPGGAGTNMFIVPTAQLAVGVGFGTEVAVRFFPQIKIGDASVGMFGFAVKHDFKQWIPGMKELPFDLSAMFGYTSMNASMNLDALQADPQSINTYNPNSGQTYTQKVEFTSSAYTFNVLISKKLSVFTPYLGLGFQSANTTLKLLGTFPVTDINNGFDPTYGAATPGDPSDGTGTYDPNIKNHHSQYVNELHDPIAIEGKLSGLRATGGFRLKFGPVTLHADYTLAQYNVASVGLGINIQSLAPFKL